MKRLTWKLIIPLTIISFSLFTKWWYTLPENAPDTIFIGFPLPFLCNGWHTSMSLQIFILELVVDLLTYFIFWFILIFLINEYLKQINVPNFLTVSFLSIAILISAYSIWAASFKENLFYYKREFNIEVMKTGYKFTWQNLERPNFYKYHPQDKNP